MLNSGEVNFVFTAPYAQSTDEPSISNRPHPLFNHETIDNFVTKHGLAVRAVGIHVGDAEEAYECCLRSGAVGVMPATTLKAQGTEKKCTLSEVKLFDDTVLRWVSGEDLTSENWSALNYSPVPLTSETSKFDFGFERIDHVVSNVPKLFEAVNYLTSITGFHEFSEFTAADVGTVDSGLNSMVLANNNEFVLLPVNEPTFGTKRKSQIQNYLEHNQGSGVQHIALKTNNIFATVAAMRQRSSLGGLEFMPAPGSDYYRTIPHRLGPNTLNETQQKDLEMLGLLADKDDQGVLIQIFTKPIGDRPTIFFEIIQRIGCDVDNTSGQKKEQTAGCGGFGKVSNSQFSYIKNINILM